MMGSGTERQGRMAFTTLISTSELKDHLEDPGWVILDARFTLDDEQWGKTAYAAGHIPGARQADLADDLAGPIIAGVTGRRPFPDPDLFAGRLASWGVGRDTQVVAYDAANGLMAASRLWLMLRWLGHDNVAVLDGGLDAWLEAGLPLSSETPLPTAAPFVARVRPELLASVDDVEVAREAVDTCVFDSRGSEGYHGRGHYHDPVRGHIAGAGLADRAETTRPDGHWRSADELRRHYQALLGEVDPRDVIFYCGSGVTAAQNVLGMAIAGLDGSRMYVGSWSEWITDANRPVEL
jgi:thiosulfate/3-mercaptopyruvate sulfurtransferase